MGKAVIGITYENVVMCDCDNMDFEDVKKLAFKTLNKFNLGGFIIMNSSLGNYHIIFNEPQPKNEVFRILGWMGIMSKNPNVWKWVCMQLIKDAVTLRIGYKYTSDGKVKNPPELCYSYGELDKAVKDYLETRQMILELLESEKVEISIK